MRECVHSIQSMSPATLAGVSIESWSCHTLIGIIAIVVA